LSSAFLRVATASWPFLASTPDDRLGERLLAVDEDLVDQLGDDGGAVHRVVDDGALRGGSLTRHLSQPFFAP